jgi:hypothetical protein
MKRKTVFLMVIGLVVVAGLAVVAMPAGALTPPGAPHILCTTYSGGVATFVGLASDVSLGVPVSGILAVIEKIPRGTLPAVVRKTVAVGPDGRWTFSTALAPGLYRGFFRPFNVDGTVGPSTVIDFDPSTLAGACLLVTQGYQGYAGAAETYVNMWAPAANYRWAKLLKVRSQGVMKMLGRFDLEPLAGIGAGQVVGGKLVFWVESASNPQPATLHAYPLATAWEADQATWMAAQAGEPWTLPGAGSTPDDYLTGPTSAAPLPSGGDDWVVLVATDFLKGWLSGSIPNYGVLLTATARGSVEHNLGSSLHTQPGFRPILVVEYNP